MAFAEGYIDVAARIVEFREKHPAGSLQPADPALPYRVEVIGDQTFIVVVAAAYRSEEDARPGIGMAYEQFPGRTPYTRGSELQNAETSAWGRAIVAALAADTRKGIASQEEVRNRQAERDPDQESQEPSPADKMRDQILAYSNSKEWDPKAVAARFQTLMSCPIQTASFAVLAEFFTLIKRNGLDESEEPS
jgi:hypothetical protein